MQNNPIKHKMDTIIIGILIFNNSFLPICLELEQINCIGRKEIVKTLTVSIGERLERLAPISLIKWSYRKRKLTFSSLTVTHHTSLRCKRGRGAFKLPERHAKLTCIREKTELNGTESREHKRIAFLFPLLFKLIIWLTVHQ